MGAAGLGRIAGKLVGDAGHGRQHHADLVAAVDLALDGGRRGLDSGDVGNRCAAEFLYDSSHNTYDL